MELLTIKNLCEKQGVEIKQLAKAVGMSEPNLHRCIRMNKIQAQDLENIAKYLNVSIIVFFDKPDATININSSNIQQSEEIIRLRAENDVLREVIGLFKKNDVMRNKSVV